MPAGTTPIFIIAAIDRGVQVTSADTTAKKTVATAGTNGALIEALWIQSNDTAAVNAQFYINDGATDFYIGVVAVPIGSGYTTVARVDAMATLSPLLGYLRLGPSYILKVACLATMTAAKTMDVLAMGGDY